MGKLIVDLTVTAILISLSVVVFLIYNNDVINNSITLAIRYNEDKQYDLALNKVQTALIKDLKKQSAYDFIEKKEDL